MNITKKNIKEVGSCNFCNKGKLAINGHGLIYPYSYVLVVHKPDVIEARFCEECFKEFCRMGKKFIPDDNK